MKKVFMFCEASLALEKIEIETLRKNLLNEHFLSQKTASFELYQNFDLCSFNWYDITSNDTDTYHILIYLDKQDFFVFCENQKIKDKMSSYMPNNDINNGDALHHFLFMLLEKDMDMISDLEDKIMDCEETFITKKTMNYMNQILEFRKELLRLKKYYTQLQAICDGLVANENQLLNENALMHINIMHNRVDRCMNSIMNLNDYVIQMRESYQSQIDLEQNSLMKFFTLITALFLPLTLMVGWYGMNFHYMPELDFPYSYPIFIIISLLIWIGLIIYFKKRKWF